MANQFFPGAIVKYLEKTDLKDLSGDALILLVNVFDDRTVSAASDEFTQKLIGLTLCLYMTKNRGPTCLKN